MKISLQAGKTAFSAGLDVIELYKPDLEKAREFWKNLQDIFFNLYGAPFPTAVAINGHSPAGGCFLTICCDYRVMLPKFTIGLNETQFGIIPPVWFMDAYRNAMTPRQAELALTLGKLFLTEEALKLGLVNEIASNKNEAIAKCRNFLLRHQGDNFKKHQALKMSIRAKDMQRLKDRRKSDEDLFISYLLDNQFQKQIFKFITVLTVQDFTKLPSAVKE
jgi:3,2-trans-enoyl-CoA isomerase